MKNSDSNKVNRYMIGICMLEPGSEFITQPYEIIDNKCFTRMKESKRCSCPQKKRQAFTKKSIDQ